MWRSLLEPKRRVRNWENPSEKALKPSPSFSRKLTSIEASVVIAATPPQGAWRVISDSKGTDSPAGQSKEGDGRGQYRPESLHFRRHGQGWPFGRPAK